MEEGLFYSEEALINRVIFLSDSNEINIIVEDEYKEYEYENILNRLFSYQLILNNIFPMKGKPGVKKAFEEYGAFYDGKPTIYLVDGDFDIIMNKDMVEHPNYIYLDKYNIECYYVDKDATLRFMSGKLKKRQKDIVNEIEYEAWENDTYDKLKKLFINYLIGQTIFPNEKNVGISPYTYIDSRGRVNESKIDEYVIQLQNRVPNYDELFMYYSDRFEQLLDGDVTRLVCGKYIIASLARYLRKKTSVTFKEDDFRYYLVSEFDIEKLFFLKERILNIMK
ncbi:MAG: DUF4435 domain-containing protein [Lachnospiraceae bacterium]|nr:DUF4435 domain-containing protein [Lachnospiraceae bacterium]